MNETVNNFWSIGDEFMPGMDYRQRGLPFCAFAQFTKSKK